MINPSGREVGVADFNIPNGGTDSGRPIGKVTQKIESRRKELADAALETLAELGYARTSLRDIASNSKFTHGVLHYYFKDKFDLICCAVRQYKFRCVMRYEEDMFPAATRSELIDIVVERMTRSMTEDTLMHRLWYDLRSQAMFESVFRKDVIEIDEKLEDMTWGIGARLAEMTGRPLEMSSTALYAQFDGLFQRSLLRHLSGIATASAELQDELRRLLSSLAEPGPAPP